MLQRLAGLTAFLLILGCAHTLRRDSRVDPDLLPPDAAVFEKTPDAANARWFRLFADAMKAQESKQRDVACLSFRALSVEKNFPLKDLALLRAHQACPFTEDLSTPWHDRPETVEWFAEDVFKARQAEWEKMTLPERVEFLWEKAAVEKTDRGRELLLIDAAGIAEKSGDTALAEAARQRLWKNSPRLMPRPKKSDLAAVAADLRRWREFGRSVALERRRLAGKRVPPEEKFAVLKSIRQTYKTAQMKTEMLATTAELANFARVSFKRNRRDPAAARRLLEAKSLFARTVWTENRRDLAFQALNEVRRDLGGLVSLEEVNFILGRLYEESGDLGSAEGMMEAALKERPHVPGLRDKIRWARAWLLHKANKREEAIAAFDELAREAKDSSDRVRAAYWGARDLPEGEPRKRALAAIKDSDPIGFYGLMATRDLGERLPPVQSPPGFKAPSLTSSPDLNLKAALVAEWMIALGIKDGTARVLDTIQSDLRKNPRAGEDAWLRVTSGYARAGEFLPLFALMGTLPPETRDRLLFEQPELLFPKPWLNEVDQAARDAKIPRELLFAIMRQESAFNPRARSHAEAYGLTQLLPRNAKVHARARGIPYGEAEDLYDPKTSIRLGAWEIRTLLDRWKGRWIPAVASYNASADAVRGWLRTRMRPDPVEFIEEIPYEETRAYVKLVMRNQVFYQRMLADAPTPFPEKCLDVH